MFLKAFIQCPNLIEFFVEEVMGEKTKNVEVATEGKIEEINAQSREIIREIVMKEKDDKDSTDHLSGEQMVENRTKKADVGDFNNNEHGNSSDEAASKVRCSLHDETDQSRAMATGSNVPEVEVKNGRVEDQKLEREPLHGDEVSKDEIDAQVSNGEKVEETDRLDVTSQRDGITYEGEDEKDKNEVEGESKSKEDDGVQVLQDKGEERKEKIGEMTNPSEEEEQSPLTLRNARKDDYEIEGELSGQEHNDAEGNLKENVVVKNLESGGKSETNDDKSDHAKGIDGEKVNDVEFKANEDDTDSRTLENVKEDGIELISGRVENKQLKDENDKDDEIEEQTEEKVVIKIGDDKEKCDEIEAEEKDVEERVEEAKEEKSYKVELHKEELVEEKSQEKEEKEDIVEAKDGNENIKVEGKVEDMDEVEKADEKCSENRENETEDEAVKKVEQKRSEDGENEFEDDAVEKIEKEGLEDEEKDAEDKAVEKIDEKGSEDEVKQTEDDSTEKKEESEDEKKHAEDEAVEKLDDKGLEDEENETEDDVIEKNEEKRSEDEEKETEDDAVEKKGEEESEDEEKETKDGVVEKTEDKKLEEEEKETEDEAVEKKEESRLQEGKETEDEAAEKKAKKPGKPSKRKGKRTRTGEFKKRKIQKQGKSSEKGDYKEETAEEDNEMTRKYDDEDRAPKVSKKMRLSAKRSAERKQEAEKSAKKNKSSSESIDAEPITPYIGRPQRERKTVERLVSLIEKDASRDLKIGKGLGTPLKDIPNVSSKVSKRKTDDTLKLLHTIIFGRRTKAIQVKNNLLRFSGFVWPDDEDKHRSKVKVKFEKCNKEKLLEFCDLFDLSVTKGSSKKEDIVSKLIDFLIHPRASTMEKDKDNPSNKRSKIDSSSKNPSSKRQKISGSKRSKRIESDDNDSDNSQDEEGDGNDDEVEEKSYEEEGNNSSDLKSDENDDSEEEYRGNRSSSKRKRPSSKGKKPHLSAKKKLTKSGGKKQPKSTAKKLFSQLSYTNEKGNSKDKSALTDDELRDATCVILNQVDFNTATFTDILKLLGKQFDTDLTSRKDSIKTMIQEELTKFAEEEAQRD